MANGSVGGGSRNWSASNRTRAAARTAKRLSKGERGMYDAMRAQGLSDSQARRDIASIRRSVGRREVPF